MSNNFSDKIAKDCKEEEIKPKTEPTKEKLIDPLSLLSSDLLNEIDKIENNSLSSKKSDTEKDTQLDEENENEEEESNSSNINLNLNPFNNNNNINRSYFNSFPQNMFLNNGFNNNQSQNLHFNNFTNKLNFFNNSFTMNGKPGWICIHCKNFNYESK